MNLEGTFALFGYSFPHSVRFRKTHIPFAAVRTLRATPVQLVPAHGTNRVSRIVGGILKLTYAGTAYTESTDNLVVRYTDGNGVAVSDVIEMTGFITLTANSFTQIRPAVDGIVSVAAGANAPLVLHNNGDGEFGNSGTGALTAYLAYQVFDIT